MLSLREVSSFLVLTDERQLVRVIETTEFPSQAEASVSPTGATRQSIVTDDGRPVFRQGDVFQIGEPRACEATLDLDSAIQISWRMHSRDSHWVAHGELRAVVGGEIRIAREVDLPDNHELYVEPELKQSTERAIRRDIRAALDAVLKAVECPRLAKAL